MKNEKTIYLLKTFMDKNSLKKIEVEHTLKLPKNSLSNFLSGKKELPDKWVKPIIHLCNEVSILSTSAEINPMAALWVAPSWVKGVEDYCSEAGILPTDLISFHKEYSNKGILNQIKEKKPIPIPSNKDIQSLRDMVSDVKKGKVKEEKENSSGYNYHDSYRKSKLGF